MLGKSGNARRRKGPARPFGMAAALFLMCSLSGLLVDRKVYEVRAEDAAPRFLSVLSDVPLVPGFEETEEDTLLFDKPGGRIVQAYALGPGGQGKSALAYYQAVLPRFGWFLTSGGEFVREEEHLTIETAQLHGKTVIFYMLAPQSDGGSHNIKGLTK